VQSVRMSSARARARARGRARGSTGDGGVDGEQSAESSHIYGAHFYGTQALQTSKLTVVSS